MVTVNPLPTISAPSVSVCTGSTATLTASGANTYTWNTGATGSSITVTPSVTTTYSVTGTNSNGCKNTATAVVTTNTCSTTGINGYNAANLVNIYPNPASDYLNIDLGTLSDITTVEMYDITGKLVLIRNTADNFTQLCLTDISKGTYFVKVINEKAVVAVKMIMISK